MLSGASKRRGLVFAIACASATVACGADDADSGTGLGADAVTASPVSLTPEQAATEYQALLNAFTTERGPDGKAFFSPSSEPRDTDLRIGQCQARLRKSGRGEGDYTLDIAYKVGKRDAKDVHVIMNTNEFGTTTPFTEMGSVTNTVKLRKLADQDGKITTLLWGQKHEEGSDTVYESWVINATSGPTGETGLMATYRIHKRKYDTYLYSSEETSFDCMEP